MNGEFFVTESIVLQYSFLFPILLKLRTGGLYTAHSTTLSFVIGINIWKVGKRQAAKAPISRSEWITEAAGEER
jgi:hypothetical protein